MWGLAAENTLTKNLKNFWGSVCFGDQQNQRTQRWVQKPLEAFTMLPWFEGMAPAKKRWKDEWFEWDPKSKVICFLLWESPKGAISWHVVLSYEFCNSSIVLLWRKFISTAKISRNTCQSCTPLGTWHVQWGDCHVCHVGCCQAWRLSLFEGITAMGNRR